jgi:hypothetical protein
MSLRKNLIEMTDQVFVVAHKEDTTSLESVLSAQGFLVKVQRGPYSSDQEKYSSAVKCLINHANVWRRVKESRKTAIVVEADFVPVKNFSTRVSPLPDDKEDLTVGFAWLYSAGSILYGFDGRNFPHGHGNTTCAYMLAPHVADYLLKFFEREMSGIKEGQYAQWETYLGIYLRKEHEVLNYIPVYQYGEHGGIPQPEHSANKVRSWHQADVLIDELAFMPLYAKGSKFLYFIYRGRAILRAWARLFLLRFYDPRCVNKDSSRGKVAMGWFSVARLLKLSKV